MSIAKLKQIEIIGLNSEKARLMEFLQRLGIIQLIEVGQKEQAAQEPLSQQADLLQMQEAISYLSSFKEEKPNILETMVGLKPIIHQSQLADILKGFDFKGALKELAALRHNLKELLQQKEKLTQKRLTFMPWQELKLSLEELHPSQHCSIMLGVLSRRDYTAILDDCTRENISFFYEVIGQDRADVYVTIIYIKKDFERLEPFLKMHRFNFVVLGHGEGTIKDNILDINKCLAVLEGQILNVKEKISECAKEQFKLMVIYDYFLNINMVNEANQNLGKQKYTFILKGWLKEKDIPFLKNELVKGFKGIEVFISQPESEENVPVILENRPLLQPFEFITHIYGMPKYNELDPTPFLAPFFFLYFGFCVSDVGYGLMLSLLSFIVLKRLKMGAQGKKFWKLFFYCGISTIIVGAATGSWFGNLFDMLADNNKIFLPLKTFKDSLILLDPLKEPTKLLAIALSLGIIQVWFGNIIAALGNIKNRRYLNIALDQVPMLLFLFGLTGLALIFLKLSNSNYATLFKYSASISALWLVLTQGRSEKGLGSKLFYGMYNLYNALSGYLSDILSYSRLWALGLVTGVMASTINLISVQFSQIVVSTVPFIGKITFLKILISSVVITTIFILGHIASFMMNLLGAFVHPLRLQFVEFFSKFFKSGGSSFKPFKVETKYVKLN